jgi:Cu+-exporting ATPase
LYVDSSKALNVFTAVLIIACPCAIALAAPFTLGNMLRILGKKKFYLKNATVVEQLAAIDTVIFDKTGTLTTSKENTISYKGEVLKSEEKAILKSSLRASNHPLSRLLYNSLSEEILVVDGFKEYTGKGIEAIYQETKIKVGSSSFVRNESEKGNLDTSVHISIDNQYKGKYIFKNAYRNGVERLFSELKSDYSLAVVSGDNEGEKNYLEELLPKNTTFLFNQKPEDKLVYVEELQEQKQNVIMIGDGLNDAGALAQSNVGIALSENINVFSPACDAILDASKFNQIGSYIKASKKAIQIIKYSFILSLLYNLIGLYFATTGQLKPVIAAILMPLSSISIVVFTTVATNLLGNKIK